MHSADRVPQLAVLACPFPPALHTVCCMHAQCYIALLSPLAPAVPCPQDIEAIEKNLESAIKEAEATCNGGDAAHCAAA